MIAILSAACAQTMYVQSNIKILFDLRIRDDVILYYVIHRYDVTAGFFKHG